MMPVVPPVIRPTARARRPIRRVVLLLWLQWSSATPAQARDTPAVCVALKARTVDVAGVKRAVASTPGAMDETCSVPRSAVSQLTQMAAAIFTLGLSTLGAPGLSQAYSPLELAVLRESEGAVRALAAAGADPTARRKKSLPAVRRAVALDLEAGGTRWTDAVLSGWRAPLPAGVLTTHQLDQLFAASVLEAHLRDRGLPAWGTDGRGTTWLHRALYRDALSLEMQVVLGKPDSEDAMEVRRAITVEAALARGVPVDLRDHDEHTALYYAAVTENWRAFDGLLSAGAHPERAGAEPDAILYALVLTNSGPRFGAMVARLLRSGHVDAADLAPLAEVSLRPGRSQQCRAVADAGIEPTLGWWNRVIEQGNEDRLDRTLACGFVPSHKTIRSAVRLQSWPAVRKLVKHASLTGFQVRRLQVMAAVRGAPQPVKKALSKAHRRARRRTHRRG